MWESWIETSKAKQRERWEQVRFLGAVTVQPYSSKSITPKDICKFAWDEDAQAQDKPKPTETREEILKKFEAAKKQAGIN